MSSSLKLSTALPGDDAINGLDALADDLVGDPSQMICAVIICDVKDVRFVTDLEAHIPTLRFRRGEAWPLAETPEAVRIAMIQRSEARLGRTPLPFGEVVVKGPDAADRPNPDDCDHVDFHVERDHLEDVPEGTFRAVCLRCGWIEYRPIGDLEDFMAMRGYGQDDDQSDDQDQLPAERPDDVPEVWVYGDDVEADAHAATAALYAVEEVE